ncbi:MAG TPA: hypothetical protein EYP17_11965 [Candidatus Latescibacteria bacterium]|nr:hypothetical protein [Candidatus Latescibacterota bacterium]
MKLWTGLALATSVLLGCGGASGPIPSEPGKVVVRNETGNKLKATVYAGEGDPVEIWIDPYGTEEISETLPGGTKVKVVLEAVTGGIRRPMDIELAINGNLMIRVTKVAYEGPITYEVTGG